MFSLITKQDRYEPSVAAVSAPQYDVRRYVAECEAAAGWGVAAVAGALLHLESCHLINCLV